MPGTTTLAYFVTTSVKRKEILIKLAPDGTHHPEREKNIICKQLSTVSNIIFLAIGF
jgi:hypothetical protein